MNIPATLSAIVDGAKRTSPKAIPFSCGVPVSAWMMSS